MKRSPMKVTYRKPLSPKEREQAELFHGEGVGQLCAMCGTWWAEADVHHVVAKQELEDRGLPLYDRRNALPLCPIRSVFRGEHCHERHENAAKRIPFRKLRAANIDYAYEVLGPFAADYIRARYPMTEEQR